MKPKPMQEMRDYLQALLNHYRLCHKAESECADCHTLAAICQALFEAMWTMPKAKTESAKGAAA
jgi:hypothetical protein